MTNLLGLVELSSASDQEIPDYPVIAFLERLPLAFVSGESQEGPDVRQALGPQAGVFKAEKLHSDEIPVILNNARAEAEVLTVQNLNDLSVTLLSLQNLDKQQELLGSLYSSRSAQQSFLYKG